MVTAIDVSKYFLKVFIIDPIIYVHTGLVMLPHTK